MSSNREGVGPLKRIAPLATGIYKTAVDDDGVNGTASELLLELNDGMLIERESQGGLVGGGHIHSSSISRTKKDT